MNANASESEVLAKAKELRKAYVSFCEEGDMVSFLDRLVESEDPYKDIYEDREKIRRAALKCQRESADLVIAFYRLVQAVESMNTDSHSEECSHEGDGPCYTR